jgi:hypothetical protein
MGRGRSGAHRGDTDTIGANWTPTQGQLIQHFDYSL